MNHKIFILLAGAAILISCENNNFTNSSANSYQSVKIGTQVWMKKNLDVDHYRNGDSIPEVRDIAEWDQLITGAWCYYNNDTAVGKIYGKFYNWYAVNDPRGLAPKGWHIPSDSEWISLENFLISNGYNYDETTSGNKFAKSLASSSGWCTSSNTGAVGYQYYLWKQNTTGFSALAGGYKCTGNVCPVLCNAGEWWSSTSMSDGAAYSRLLWYDYANMMSGGREKTLGLSIRCIKN
ncbi:MAG: fibrobacter succinogenes major paralogous domain-containing protein [Candidatus Kapabacteria bacterium]|nr:fibrobacter succinogenes major paralogous domain-containing protein [Candidatus Kapabacteria bacterium]